MRTAGLATVWGALLALGGLGACGGNVVVDGGSGGAGTISASSSASSGTGDSNPRPLCESVCEFLSSSCGESDCLDECLQSASMAPQCSAQFAALLRCFQSNLDTCDTPPECTQELDEYSQCLGGGDDECGTADCAGSSDGSCTCKGSCRDIELGVECSPQGMTSSCTCFLDGQLVGTCQEVGSACSFEDGCCAALFFSPR